jgi:CheY-like chemotaxis protein
LNSPVSNTAVKMVLIEDDAVDAESVDRALTKLKLSTPVLRFNDGKAAIEGLRAAGKDKVQRPYLILLDLNLPRMNGLEFLDELRADPLLRDNIVFVLTTSCDARDIREAYARNVAGYIVKARVEEGLLEAFKMLGRYGELVEFPREVTP